MPHEFRGLASASHETLTIILVGGLVSAVMIIAFALFLQWRHRRKPHGEASKPSARSKARRRKKR